MRNLHAIPQTTRLRAIDEFYRFLPPTSHRETERAYQTIRELIRAADTLRMTMADRSPRIGLCVTEREMRLLSVELSPMQRRDYFGPEGALLLFMGLPLHVIPDWPRY